jgi:RHS repeat-associated protein
MLTKISIEGSTTKNNPLGMLTGIYTGSGVQNLSYAWDIATGNMAGRTDHLHNLTELFTYDNSWRLTGISGPEAMEMEYAHNGNILSKTGVGEYSYGSLPHAVTEVENTGGIISSAEVNIGYSATNRVQSLTKGADSLALWYNDANQRSLSKHYVNGTLTATHYYDGLFEAIIQVSSPQTVRYIHYIPGGEGIVAILNTVNDVDSMYYLHTDHLGSYDKITNQAGTVVESYSFDAWGRRRNPVNWTYSGVATSFLFDRGFTGHEHLDVFGLINMNARLYDPVLGRFLGPDNYVQSPGNSQSYNRYSYCLNNPLKYTDPSGEKWHWPKFRWQHCIPIFGQFNYLMEMINDNTVKLRQKMVDAKIPDLSIGVNVNSGGDLTVYGGLTNPARGGVGVAVGYNSDNGWGIGSTGTSRGTELYYPSKNYNLPEQNAIKGISESMQEWRAINRRRAYAYPGYLTMIGWQYEYTNTPVANIYYLGLSYNELWGGEVAIGFAQDIVTDQKKWFISLGFNGTSNLNASFRVHAINYRYSGNTEFTLDALQGPMFEWSINGGDIIVGGYTRHWFETTAGRLTGNGLNIGVGVGAIPVDGSIGINFLKFFKP